MQLLQKTIVLFSVSLLIISSACNKKDDVSKIKVAMLAEGHTFDDHSFLASCKEGMERAKVEFDLEVEYNIDTATDNYQERIDVFGNQGFNLIIAIGFMWNDAVVNAAQRYPGTRFIFVDAELSEMQDNVTSVLFDVDEAAFPLGFLTAWW